MKARSLLKGEFCNNLGFKNNDIKYLINKVFKDDLALDILLLKSEMFYKLKLWYNGIVI